MKLFEYIAKLCSGEEIYLRAEDDHQAAQDALELAKASGDQLEDIKPIEYLYVREKEDQEVFPE